VLGVVVVIVAPAALAGWSSALSAGPLPVSSATIAASTGAAATTIGAACTMHVTSSIQVNVSWTATTSAFATGYTIQRGTAAGGPFATVGTVSGVSTVTFTDTTGTLALSTPYYYVVVATFASWTSPNSNVATVTTPDKNCHGGT
jgi:fibronectin type 3 domain-containing protein